MINDNTIPLPCLIKEEIIMPFQEISFDSCEETAEKILVVLFHGYQFANIHNAFRDIGWAAVYRRHKLGC